MLNIRKGEEPKKLASYRSIEGADWDGPASEDGLTFGEVKDEIRQALHKEQKGLCAYCMCRLGSTSELDVKIEHFFPRAESRKNPELKYKNLEYSNLLLCCLGLHSRVSISENAITHRETLQNEVRIQCDITCDSAKGNSVLENLPNPANNDVQSHICYTPDGRIETTDEGWYADINGILNLNCMSLVLARRQAKATFMKKYTDKARQRMTGNEKTKKHYARLLENEETIVFPFLGIILDCLKKG